MNSDWMQTYSGIKFFPTSPLMEDLRITDIAHALSNLCRFGGHSTEFYSVAEHSMLVSEFCPNKYRLWGLLHDAAEAYLGDMIYPIKRELKAYQEFEFNLMSKIAWKYYLRPLEVPPKVKKIDHRILEDEQIQVMGLKLEWYHIGEPLGAKIRFLSPKQAEKKFLDCYRLLKEVDNEV